jgi:hypothetical protein
MNLDVGESQSDLESRIIATIARLTPTNQIPGTARTISFAILFSQLHMTVSASESEFFDSANRPA